MVYFVFLIPLLLLFLLGGAQAARQWQAKIELKNAVDAAALSAVKTWAESASTAQAQLDADAAFSANSVIGQSYPLVAATAALNGRTTAAAPSPTEPEILFGSIEDVGGTFQFTSASTSAEIAAPFSVTVSAALVGDPSSNGGPQLAAWRISDFRGPASASLDGLSVDLSPPTDGAAPPWQPAAFDFRAAAGGRTALPLVFSSGATTATNARVAAALEEVAQLTSGVNAATYRVQPGSQPTKLLWSFRGFQPGDAFAFGTPLSAAATSTLNPTLAAQLTLWINGQPFTGVLPPAGTPSTETTLTGALAGSRAFGVRIRKTVPVSLFSSSWLGLDLGVQSSTAEAFARYAPQLGRPQLVHVETVALRSR